MIRRTPRYVDRHRPVKPRAGIHRSSPGPRGWEEKEPPLMSELRGCLVYVAAGLVGVLVWLVIWNFLWGVIVP